jgi:hypothetical protein
MRGTRGIQGETISQRESVGRKSVHKELLRRLLKGIPICPRVPVVLEDWLVWQTRRRGNGNAVRDTKNRDVRDRRGIYRRSFVTTSSLNRRMREVV